MYLNYNYIIDFKSYGCKGFTNLMTVFFAI